MHSFVRAVADSAAARLLFSSPRETDPPPRLLVALSGGPDSCALFLALCEGADAGLCPRPVAAAHFHHGLRGEDADDDAAFAAALCARLSLPCQIGLGAVYVRGRSPNAAARRDRYEFLIEAARAVGANVIVTAHTADDQAETVLLRILRGTSIDGLAAMPPLRALRPDIRIARPLLSLYRSDVEAYCRDRGVTPRRDPSNEKDRYARARLRHRLPDLARDFNPRLTDALIRLSKHAAADADLLTRLSEGVWQRAVRRNWPGLSVHLDAGVVADADPALRRRVLLRALLLAYGAEEMHDTRCEEAATGAFVARLEEAVRKGSGAHDLPGGVHAYVSSGRLVLERTTTVPEDDGPAPIFPVPLSIPGVAEVRPARLRVRAEEWPGPSVPLPALPPRALEVYLDRDAALSEDHDTMATGLLAVRTARAGDRIALLGMGGKTRLVRDVMADAGWETTLRDSAALVTRSSDEAILWIVGLAQSEETRISAATRAVVRLSADFDC